MRRRQCLLAGIAAACYLGSRWIAHWLCFPLGLLILGLVRRKGKRGELRTWAALGAGGALIWISLYSFLFLAPAQQMWNTVGTYTVTAVDYPSQTGERSVLDVRLQPEFGCSILVRLYTELPCDEVRPGDQLEVTTRLISPEEAFPAAPSVYTSQGIYALSAEVTALTHLPAEKTPLSALPKVAAHRMREIVGELFPGEARGLMLALLTGEQEELSDTLSNELSRTGLRHLVAVSGLHVSFLVGAVMFLPGDSRIKSLAAVPILLFFCALTGGGPSIVRATIMGITALLAPFFRRDSDSGAALELALLFLLAKNPFSIENVGLQLSFASVWGILLTGKPLCQWLLGRRLLRNRKWICQSLAVTLGAMAFTLPLSTLSFDTISLIAPLANLLVVWAVALIFSGGLFAALLGFAALPAAQILALPVRGLLVYFLNLVRFLAQLPFCALTSRTACYRLWLWAVFGVVLLLLVREETRKRGGRYAGLLAASLVFLVLLNRASLTAGALAVQVLDVGQGQCVLFLSDTEAVAVDCGGYDAGNTLADALGDIGEEQLDLLLLTHFDSDHVNGLPQLLERVTVKTIAVPNVQDDGGNWLEVKGLAEENGIELWEVTEDEARSFGLARIEIFAPVGEGEDNDRGLSACVRAEDFSVLVTGDMDADTEERLIEKQDLSQINMLVAGHHGSRSSTGEALLEAIQPETVVISAGEERSYGHPAQETLDRLKAAGCVVYRTDLQGTVTLTTDISD